MQEVDHSNKLITAAVACLERVNQQQADVSNTFNQFGKYIACELHALPTIQAQQWAKMQIQAVICQAHAQPPAMEQPGQLSYGYRNNAAPTFQQEE